MGALADQAAVKIDAISLTEDFRVLKAEVYAIINGATATQLDGLLFGIADGELSATEIAEAIVAEPADKNDNLANEHSMRPVWVMGAVSDREAGQVQAVFIGENGGPLMKWTKKWTFNNPEGWDYFVFNNSGTVLTTGADCRVLATHFGLWVQ